jgi:hypothetical protein
VAVEESADVEESEVVEVVVEDLEVAVEAAAEDSEDVVEAAEDAADSEDVVVAVDQ